MLVEMKDICKDYPQGKETVRILKNINLQVEEGDYLAIMGPSGSGKTTLMNLLGCLDVPTSGEYLLAGEDVTQAGCSALCSRAFICCRSSRPWTMSPCRCCMPV